jgi:hypothetical protein
MTSSTLGSAVGERTLPLEDECESRLESSKERNLLSYANAFTVPPAGRARNAVHEDGGGFVRSSRADVNQRAVPVRLLEQIALEFPVDRRWLATGRGSLKLAKV